MGKNNGTTKYGGVVQLLVIAGVVVTPLLALNWMDLELFSVSKTTFSALLSSIKPWLCPPYVYLLINFIIFFIAASSSIRYFNPVVFNPPIIRTGDDHHQWQSLTDEDDSFIQSSLAFPVESESSSEGSGLKDPHGDESVVDKVKRRELRKSKTFQEGVSDSKQRGRRERYVRILSQEELDRQVEAFIYRCKQDTNLLHKSETQSLS